jgi:RNA polymerase sigma factor (sigma-70 family)
MPATTVHTDQYFIDGLRNNNTNVINEIYKKYSPKIYNWVQQNSGDAEQAQDVFQESIIAIYNKAKDGNFELTCPFDAFLFVVVRNKWFAYLKQNNKINITKTDISEYNTIAAEQDAHVVYTQERQYQLMTEKLSNLNEGCQTLLKLCWQGLKMEEVAKKMDVSYAYVRKKKSICITKLIENVRNSPEFLEFTQ